MAELSHLPVELWRLTKSVFRELLNLWRMPWRYRLFCEEVGAPELPAHLFERMETLVAQEDNAELLADALEVIDGMAEAIRLSDPDADDDAALARAFDIVSRMFLPIVFVCAKREAAFRPWWWKALVLLPMIDNQIAQHVPQGFLGTRIAALSKQTFAALLEDDDRKLLWAPFAIYAAAVVLDEILERWGKGEMLSTEHWEALWGLGWESELPPPRPDVDEPPRPLPIWMAQRTVSMRWERKQLPFKLGNYARAEQFDEIFDRPRAQRPVIGLTMVPIPEALGGPDVFVQLDGATGLPDAEVRPNVWRRIRGDADVGIRIPLGARRVGPTTGAGFSVELSYIAPEPATAAPSAQPPATNSGGSLGGVALDIGGAALVLFAGYAAGRGSVVGDDLGLVARVQKARLTLTPKGRVLGELLKQSVTVSLDAGLILSNRDGLMLEGSGGLEAYWAIREQLGNEWGGMEVSYARLALELERSEHGSKLSLVSTFGITINFLCMSLILDGIGARMTLDTGRDHRDGNLLRLANLERDLVAPTGYGLKIDWCSVRGGGFFKYEPALDRFSGVVEILVELTDGPGWALRGVGFTEPREGGGSTTLISVTLEQDTPSPGIAITGVGLMIGLHRRANGNAIRDALPTGGMDALLFPPDPLGRSGELVASLAAMFPPAPPDDGAHVFGLLLRVSFGDGDVIAKLGIIFEFGSGTDRRGSKVFVAASVKTAFPGAVDRVIHIEIVGLGEVDLVSGDFEIRAQLRNSRLFGCDLEGGALLFRGDPDPDVADSSRGLFASLGGYHPSFFGGVGPQRARVDKRLRMVFERGNSLKFEVALYLARTPGAYHFGLRGALEVHAGGFGLDGRAWIDGIVQTDWSFDIEAGGSLDLILFDRTVAALELVGKLTRESSTNLSGRVSFKVLWWSVSKCFDKELCEGEETARSSVDVKERFLETVQQTESYAAQRPGDVTITAAQRAGIWNAPEQPLRFLQKVMPLDTQIERLGSTPLPSPTTVHVERVTIGSRQHTPRPALGEFAPGLYLSLEKDAALRAPVAEHWPAGFDAAGDEVAAGDEQTAGAEYDEIIVDREYRDPPARPKRRVLPPLVRAALIAPSASVNVPIRIARPAYATKSGGSTFANAWAERSRFVRRVEGS